MATLPDSEIAELLLPYDPDVSEKLVGQLSLYLDLLCRWNARMNLSAIREPRRMVERHFGESLFAARHLPGSGTLLDLGSGAGFPGLPIALAKPGLVVTLAESQNKKAAFLHEVVRTLAVPVEIWSGRAEDLPASRFFEVVTMRAVDNPVVAISVGRSRLAPGGMLAHLTTGSDFDGIRIPGSGQGLLQIS